MSIIRKSEDLEIIVLRIFEDFCKFGGDFYIISPWIQNFSFSEAISDEYKTFGTEPSLYVILRKCSELQPRGTLKIITHNFGLKPKYSPLHIEEKAQRFNVKININSLKDDGILGSLFEFYLSLLKDYKEYSKFNSPWMLTSFRDFKELVEDVREEENYTKTVFDLVHGLEQVGFNLQYLNDLRKFLEIENVKIMLHNNFHAKIFLAGSSCVTGSSNWTFSGFTKNDEINLFFSETDSPEEMIKIKERCYELEHQAIVVNLENVAFSILLHKYLEFIYSIFFDWLTGNKNKLVK
jgi:phosphatidylserine/phosphatidylglycerophosphate/cardiolipin synthase-like enzyme